MHGALVVTTIVATFVIPTTARLWIPDTPPVFQNTVRMLHDSSRPIVATWKRLLPPKSRRRVEQHNTDASTINATESMPGSIGTSSSSSASASSSSSWLDRTMTRVVSIITYFAIGQGIIHFWNANRSDIATELANKMFSQDSFEVIQTIQSILANVHTEHGVVDVFGKYRTIDVLASIIALSRLQRIVVPHERAMRIKRNHDDVDLSLANDLAHYAKYAHAAYGWTFDLAFRWKVHFGGNNQALVRLTGIHRDDIVKAVWNAKAPHRPAYFIIRDHDYQTIVLCIRGTWSVNDMLTNLYCTSTSKDLFRQLFYREVSSHRGMLEAAKAVYSDAETIISQELLENPQYTLVLTGHSLGGGCAALLGKLFENQYPTLKVYLFGAPCVVPERNSISKNVVSVIAKGDPFSCLSLGHIANLSKGIAYLCNDDDLRNDVLLHTRNSMNDDKDDNLSWCMATLNMLRKPMNAEKLYPPGRILLLHHDKSTIGAPIPRRLHWWRWRQRRRKNKQVTLQEVHVQYFQDLIISANMFDLSKHLPSMYVSALNDFVRKYETNRLSRL